MKRALFLPLVIACGSPNPPPAQTAQTPSAAQTPAPEAATKSDVCLAGSTRKKPSLGWTQVGTIVVTVEDDRPKSFEARDSSGKVVESNPAPKAREEARAMLEAATCKLGGILYALDGEQPKGSGKATLLVLKPTAEDEKADVTRLCKPPEDIEGADESQAMAIAVQIYGEQLTTKKWRAWLRDLGEQNRKLEGSPRVAMRKSKADDLAAGAKKDGILGPCWFEQGLRKATH